MADILDAMRRNSAADWTVAVCGDRLCPARRALHAAHGQGIASQGLHPSQRDILTVPVRARSSRCISAGWSGSSRLLEALVPHPDYPVLIEALSPEDGGGYLATVPDPAANVPRFGEPGPRKPRSGFAGTSDGDMRELAARNVSGAIAASPKREAFAAGIEQAQALGRAIPAPSRRFVPAQG